MVVRETIWLRTFLDKDATHPDARAKSGLIFDLRPVVEEGKSNPAIVVMICQCEIGEADRKARSLSAQTFSSSDQGSW